MGLVTFLFNSIDKVQTSLSNDSIIQYKEIRFMKVLCNHFFLILTIFLVVGCDRSVDEQNQDFTWRTTEQRLGTHFNEVDTNHFKPPIVTQLEFPIISEGSVLWGATGRDYFGHIYFGVSTYSKNSDTAFLYQYSPQSNSLIKQSDVISQLKKAGLYSDGISQNKLHSKFYQAADGYLYFTSFDEQGENSKKGILPVHGGHIWRKKTNDLDWEHILTTKEALIAVNTDGRYVYALGYWGHVLYQYDTQTQVSNQIRVGAINGHISRNFLVSQNGHVFVPKIERSAKNQLIVNLNEYDSALNLVVSTPLEHYLYDNKHSKHGIVSYINMKNGDIYFVTAVGALYKISQANNSKHQVSFEVFLSETIEEGGYFPSLFSINGENFLVSFGRLPNSKHYSWLVYETSTKTTATYDFKNYDNKILLYGSVTRDNFGNLYVVGVDQSNRSKHKPIILKLSYD